MNDIMIASGGMTDGQIETLVDQLRAAARKHREQFPKEVAQQALGADNLGMRLLTPFRELIDALSIVTFRGAVPVTITESRSSKQFFKDRKGLYVGDGFENLVANAKAVDSGTKFQIDHYEITQKGGATDAKIETALKAKGTHLFEVDQLTAIIAELISAQEGGKEGCLLNNGYANLFYISSLVVHVYWNADAGGWCVSTWWRHGPRWSQGRRVFVPGN